MGTVYLVGAGPGDPGLITLKGIECLKACDVVIYDRLASYQLLGYLKKDCIKIYVGKEAGKHSKKQEEINRIIVQAALQYETVVRLKGGDPFVFGRGGEEIEELMKSEIPFEVVPGVTSAVSVPARAGIPVTHRGVSQSFHVITGHTKDSDSTLTDNYSVLAKLDGTLVFLMGLGNLEKIADNLILHGKASDTPVAVISSGTTSREKTVRGTLKDIAVKVKEEAVTSPATIVIGKVADLNYVQPYSKPLSGYNIGITGTKELCEKLEKGLCSLGATVNTVCDMQVVETSFIGELMEELKSIDQYQWIIFTSQNAIHLFFDTMQAKHIDRRKLNRIKFAVIGSGTSQVLQTYGYYADFIPNKFTSKDLAQEFVAIVSSDSKVLIPRALRGSEELPQQLKEKGIDYKEIPIYDVKGRLTENKEYIPRMDCLIFASSSGVEAFFEEAKNYNITIPKGVTIACMGAVTGEEVKKQERNADIVANVSNVDGLVNEIVNYYIDKVRI